MKKLDILKNKRNKLVAEALTLGLITGGAYTAGINLCDKSFENKTETTVESVEPKEEVKYYTEYTYIDHNASTDEKQVLVTSNTPLVAYQDGNWFEFVKSEDKVISFDEPKEKVSEVIQKFSKSLR